MGKNFNRFVKNATVSQAPPALTKNSEVAKLREYKDIAKFDELVAAVKELCGFNKESRLDINVLSLALKIGHSIMSETHLKKVVPDANVAITNYTTYRRDRDWFGNDKRAKGGVAVYIRNSGNLEILDVKRSETFECIYITMQLPSDHKMMMCGLYHPTKTRYIEDDLVSYLTDISDLFLDGSPDGTVMIGGDLNNMNLNKLSALSGLTALVDFPRRGTSILNNCLTNNCSLFSKCYPFDAQITTDHGGVIVPAGAKLKPMRCKCTMHDNREHRKIAFHAKLLEQSWDVIFDSEDVESASRFLQSTLRDLMNENFPSKTVPMSTRDPPWMTPLAKALLKKKAKAKCRSPDGCPINLKDRINAIVTENRKSLACGNMGSKAWWKKVDVLSKRKERSNPSFDEDSVRELNHYFANLCHDEDYIRPYPWTSRKAFLHHSLH